MNDYETLGTALYSTTPIGIKFLNTVLDLHFSRGREKAVAEASSTLLNAVSNRLMRYASVGNRSVPVDWHKMIIEYPVMIRRLAAASVVKSLEDSGYTITCIHTPKPYVLSRVDGQDGFRVFITKEESTP